MTLPDMVQVAAMKFGITAAEMRGPTRVRSIARARFAVAWAARQRSPRPSRKQIGRALGGRDVSTIYHAIERAKELRSRDVEFRAITDRLVMDVRFPSPE